MSSADKSGRKSVKWILIGVGAVVALLGGTWVASYFIAGNQIPAQAEVDGVAIGGLSPAQADEKLRSELDPVYAQPITLTTLAGEQVEILPLENGVTLDYEAALEAAGAGFSWNPAHIIDVFRGGGPVELPKEIDAEALAAAVEVHADEFVTEPVDATLAFEGATVVTADAVNATSLDVEATTQAVIEAFNSRELETEAVLSETEPTVTNAMVESAAAEFARPAVSGPVTLTAGGNSFDITPEQIAAVTTMSFEGGTFRYSIDGDALAEATAESLASLELPQAKDATYELSGSTITVVPAVDGQTLDTEAIASALEQGMVASGEARTVAVEPVVEKAAFTTEQAEELKPREVIGEYTTYYPHAAYRNTNLGQAAKSVNGTVLMPGDVFSLNDTLGPRTAANGYVDGYVIQGGRLVREGGGGISQSATTLYNAGFFAGLEDIEHKPHSLYFDRYPAGREATVYYGSIDLRFRNDTEYPVVIQGYTNPSSSGKRGSITFKMWSIPTYDRIVSTDLVRSNYYSGTTRTVSGADCEPQAPIQGFTVTWKRLFYKNDEVVKSEDYRWRYSAGDRIVCE